MYLKPILSVPAQKEDEDQESLKNMVWQAVNYCQSLNLSGISQNCQTAQSATFGTSDLTDSLNSRSSPSITSSTFGTVSIDLRILETPTALLYQPVEKTEQPSVYNPEIYMENNNTTEQLKDNTPLQKLFADLAQKNIDSQDMAVPETDNITIKYTPLSPISLNAKPAPSLTNYELKPIDKADYTIQSFSDMYIIKDRIKKAVELTGPITKTKTKKLAAKAFQRSIDLQISD